MQYILDSVLTPLITPERKEVILKCVASFEAMDFQACLDELQMVVEIQDGISDNAMLVSRIDDVIYTGHNEVLMTHYVQVSDEATQLERFAIVDTLSRFHSYIIPDQLALLFGGEFNNEEILSHIVAVITEMHFDEILDILLSVDDRLIESMRDEIEKQIRYRGQAEFGTTSVSRVRLVNDYLKLIGPDRMSMVVDLTNAGVRIGLKDFKQLIVESLEALDIRQPADAAFELFGLALLSNLPVNEIEKALRAQINDFSDNNTDRTVMLSALKEVFRKLAEEQAVNENP